MRASGVRIDHVAGDRAYYRLSEERVVLPERSQFPSQDAYTHTALHELGHATGHPSRLNRPTLVDHGGLRVGGVRQGGAAGGDRRDDDRREARRRPRAAARDGVRGVVGQGARERPTGDSGRRRRCAADLGLADGSRARAGRDRGAAGAGAGEPRRGDGAGTRARGGAGPGRQRRRAGGGSPLPGGCAATGCGTQRDRWGSRWRMRGWTRTRARGWPSQ